MNSVLQPRTALVAGLLATCVATAASAGLNPNFTLPLHAKASSFEPCDGYLPVDCVNHLPVVNIAPGPTAVFLFVMNYAEVAGVQTAFQPDGSWIFLFGLWDCQPGQLNAVMPAPPFGPTAGSIATAFNCLAGPQLAVVGRMFFFLNTNANGCLEQVQSSYPFGICVIDCQLAVDRILSGQEARLGKVCIGPGGNAPCVQTTAVESATWGQIKAQYR